MRGEICQQFARTRQWLYRALGVLPVEGFGMPVAQAFQPLLGDIQPGFTQQDVGEKAAAHADLAMDAPDRDVHAFLVQRLLPRQYMLVDAVHQRAVEIEKKGRVAAWHGFLRAWWGRKCG